MRYLVIILLFVFCSFHIQAKEVNKNFILVAKGSGVTPEAAQQNAIAVLSQNIFVEVKTDLQSSEVLKNENYKIEATNNVQVQSNSYFSGLSFFNQKKGKKNLYVAEVGLSTESYNATVQYLQSQINFSLIDSASRADLIVQKDMANFLLSLLMYGKKNNLPYDANYYTNLAKYASEANKIISSEVVIQFQVQNKPTANIILNGKSYKPFTNIFLQHGDYDYQIVLQGYVTKKGKISVQAGDKRTYNIYLQKQLTNKYPVSLKLVNNSKLSSAYFNNIMNTIANANQMVTQQSANNTFEMIIEPLSVNPSFEGYYNIQAKITVNLYQQGVVKKSTTITVDYLSGNQEPKIPNNVLDKQLQQKLEPFLASIYD